MRILLVISTTRYSKESVRKAIEEARSASGRHEPVHLHVLYIIEQAELEAVRRSVGEAGFLGTETQSQVVDELARQHHRIARRRIGTARRLSRNIDGLELSVQEEEADFVSRTTEVARDGEFDVVFLTRADRPFISRFLFGSQADRVARLVRSGQTEVRIEEV
ncbi:MAG: universal stress protein [Alphaproteobacteria bacterium]|nr:universal stress protein [Alphaproteobacteria bacterium]